MLQIIEKTSTNHCYMYDNNPYYIVIHDTDNFSYGANAERHASAQYNGNLGTSVHYYVDDHSIYHTLEEIHGAWAVGDGDGSSGITNMNTINIEICNNPDNDYETSRLNAIELVKYLMNIYKIPVARVVRHLDASGKACPSTMVAKPHLWIDFKNRLGGNFSVPIEAPVNGNVIGTGTIIADVLNVRSGAGTNYPIIGELRQGSTIKIAKEVNGWFDIYFGDNGGYISKDFVKLNEEIKNNSKPQTTQTNSIDGKFGTITADVLNVRSAPNTSSQILGQVNYGQKVKLFKTAGDWIHIYFGNNGGFIHKNYVKY